MTKESRYFVVLSIMSVLKANKLSIFLQSLDVTDEYIVTGSYDCTAKIWTKNNLTQWNLLHVINLHNDSVWDLKLKGETLVTGGLDGAIGIFNLVNQNLTTRFFFKVISQDFG